MTSPPTGRIATALALPGTSSVPEILLPQRSPLFLRDDKHDFVAPFSILPADPLWKASYFLVAVLPGVSEAALVVVHHA